ncbi:MAG: hypothetical protein Q4F34_06855, partial [Prevotellaceae bacterium]|nr:hypothetical protein [Prevotellaceae bacterium]
MRKIVFILLVFCLPLICTAQTETQKRSGKELWRLMLQKQKYRDYHTLTKIYEYPKSLPRYFKDTLSTNSYLKYELKVNRRNLLLLAVP